ncbi:hypothetical protein DFAR_2010006 [Desulfarculales bacterium]
MHQCYRVNRPPDELLAKSTNDLHNIRMATDIAA